MTECLAYIHLQGDRFSPAEAESTTGLHLSNKREVGQIDARGRDGGKPITQGSARLDAPYRIQSRDKLLFLLNEFLPHIETLRSLGAEEMEVWLVEHREGQCNHEFTPEELTKLANVGLTLCISCYEVEQRLTDQRQ